MHFVLHFYELFAFAHGTMMFIVFKLKAFVIRGPSTRGRRFFVSLDRVAIKEEELLDVLL